MTNRIGDKNFGLGNLTPEQRELDRWVTMARYSIVMAMARTADERMACAQAILENFRDVPNQQPSRQDTAAYARFAARTFLDALMRSEGKRVSEGVPSVATENVYNEWIDAWLPPSHAPSMTLPRMSESVPSVATENVYNEWIDAWLPPSQAPSMTLPRMPESVASVATENVYNEWIDAWLPPSHAPSMTLSRM